MKKRFSNISIILFFTFIGGLLFTGCDPDKIYEKEMYRPVLYLLSGSENVYNATYSFKETDAINYFSIGCGGSLSNLGDVLIELEHDTILLDVYNRINFVVDTASFAKLLPKERYEIGAYSVTFPANSSEQYVKIPIKVNQHGLSPDSIYFIPIAIKSISNYEVNPEKTNLLFRVIVENDYATQVPETNYQQRGTVQEEGNEYASSTGLTKVAYPLSKDKIRLLAGNLTPNDKDKKITKEEIDSYSIVAKMNEDKSVILHSYGSIEIEQLQEENYNRYYTFTRADGLVEEYIDLYYKYKVEGTTKWITTKESLQRMN